MAAKKSTIVRAYIRFVSTGTRALFWLLERGPAILLHEEIILPGGVVAR